MPTLNITTEQLRTVMQSVQNRYVRLELLNYQYQTVDNLEGLPHLALLLLMQIQILGELQVLFL